MNKTLYRDEVALDQLDLLRATKLTQNEIKHFLELHKDQLNKNELDMLDTLGELAEKIVHETEQMVSLRKSSLDKTLDAIYADTDSWVK